MNDLIRGAEVAGACFALHLSMRLAFAYLEMWWKNRNARNRAIRHVLFMNVALTLTTGAIIVRLAFVSGTNALLTLWDAAQGAQVIFLIAGLRPMWQQYKRTPLRRESEAA